MNTSTQGSFNGNTNLIQTIRYEYAALEKSRSATLCMPYITEIITRERAKVPLCMNLISDELQHEEHALIEKVLMLK